VFPKKRTSQLARKAEKPGARRGKSAQGGKPRTIGRKEGRPYEPCERGGAVRPGNPCGRKERERQKRAKGGGDGEAIATKGDLGSPSKKKPWPIGETVLFSLEEGKKG